MDSPVTIRTVAQQTNFSLTTVSRVLNGTSEKYRISKTTQDIILQAADELGYIPNMAAKTLRNSKSNTIGLIVPSLDNPFFSKVASTITKVLYAQGYVLMMSDCGNNEKEEKKIIRSLLSQNLLGIIAIPMGNKKNYELLNNTGIPTVFIDRFFTDLDYYSVSTDHYKSAVKLMNHLVQMGHKKIACIQGDQDVISNQLRVKAYLDVICNNSLEYSYLRGDSFTADKGYLETKLLLNRRDKPTAILALSDTILLGVLKAMKEEGLKIPDDISVVSIDNSTYLDYLEVPITSIEQPVQEIANLAANLLADQIKNNKNVFIDETEKIVLLDSKLINRASVRHIV